MTMRQLVESARGEARVRAIQRQYRIEAQKTDERALCLRAIAERVGARAACR